MWGKPKSIYGKFEINKDIDEEKQALARELFELLNVEKNKQDFELLLFVFNNIFATERTYSEVEETKFKDWTFRDIVKQFDRSDFYKLPKEDIIALCSEVNQKIARKLKIQPSVVTYTHKFMNKEGVKMECYANKNKIEVYNQPRNVSRHGYGYLFSILHETYHSYQFEQLDNMLNGLPFDKKCLIERANNIINEAKFFFASQNMNKKERNEVDVFIYSTDLLETSANLFAYNMMNKLFERKYLTNKRAYEYNQSRVDACLNFQMNFRDDCFDVLRKRVLKNFRTLEYIFCRYKKYVDQDTIYDYSIFFEQMNQPDIDNYLNDLNKDIQEIRKSERLKTKFFENLTLKDYYKMCKSVCDNKVNIKFRPLEELKNKYYVYMEKNMRLPYGKDIEEEMGKL